jgi:hypothetical protein
MWAAGKRFWRSASTDAGMASPLSVIWTSGGGVALASSRSANLQKVGVPLACVMDHWVSMGLAWRGWNESGRYRVAPAAKTWSTT